MKWWKWTISAGILFTVGVVSFSYFTRQNHSQAPTRITRSKEPSSPQTKKRKADHKKILSKTETPSDSLKAKGKEKAKRKPSSKQPPQNTSLPKARTVLGRHPKDLSKITIENQYNPDWKSELTTKLKSTLSSRVKNKTVMEIRPQKSVIKMTGDNKGKLYEVVLISLRRKNSDHQNNHEALVNSETGEIERTWNRTIHMPKSREDLKTSIRPTGQL